MNAITIHPDTLLGPVYLTVSNLQRSVSFYTEIIGLRLIQITDDTAWLGTLESTALLVLTSQPDAQPKPPRTTGLYHFAILLPSRSALAKSLRRLQVSDYPLQGASDHLVSEALYLSDPDGIGIELYADRPRDTWRRRNGELEIATVPLNLEDLLKEPERRSDQRSESRSELPGQIRIGHVHLHVADLHSSEEFYRNILGFDLVSRYGPSASFVSAGGYHHHIGMNTWVGPGAPSPPPNAVGLRYFTIQLPDEVSLGAIRDHLRQSKIAFDELEDGLSLRDPSHNGVFLTGEPQIKQLEESAIESSTK